MLSFSGIKTKLGFFLPEKPQISFHHALAFSLLLHLIALTFVAFTLALWVPDEDSFVPKKLDFVFLPQANEAQNALSQNSAQTKENAVSAQSANPDFANLSEVQQPGKNLPSSHDFIEQKKINPNGSSSSMDQTPLTSEQPGPTLTETSLNPNYLPVADLTSSIQSTFEFSRLNQHSLLNSKLFDKNFRLNPATLAIPEPQKVQLQMKIQKLVRKIKKKITSDTTVVWKDKNQLYQAKIHRLPAPSSSEFDELLIEIKTEEGGKVLTTEMRMRRLAFSQFAQFVDYWDPQVAIHNDEFDGRFHTNSDFRISGREGVHPKFRGKVTTTGYQIRPSDRFSYLNTDSVFLAGIEMGVEVIRFPRRFDAWLENLSKNDSLAKIFATETWITFRRNGSYLWQNNAASQNPQSVKLPQQPYAIIGKNKAILHVKGVVRGKVLVFSKRKIIVDDDITYFHHPALGNKAPDYLGLVSEKDVEIAPPQVTGPGDLHIQAAILARRYFRVRNLYGHGRATLYIYGSLTAGSLTATEPRYATRLRFDKRLNQRRPPNFPMTDHYEMLDWNGQWQIKPSQ